MNVTVDYVAQIKSAAGTDHEAVAVPAGMTLKALLADRAAHHGKAFSRLVFGANGCNRPSLIVALNDEQVDLDSAPALKDGDCLTLLTPMSGG